MTLPFQDEYALGRSAMLLTLQVVDASTRGDRPQATAKARQATNLFDLTAGTEAFTGFVTGLRVEANERLLTVGADFRTS